MATKTRFIATPDFESQCLSLVDEVASSGEGVIVTREGQPVARLVPFKRPRPLLGSVVWEKDIVSPVDESWDAES